MIPVAPFLADEDLWRKAASNLLDRAEGLLRDEIAWRRAEPCLFKEYYRLGMTEGPRWLRPARRALYRKWHWKCEAQHKEAKQLCPFSNTGDPLSKPAPKDPA